MRYITKKEQDSSIAIRIVDQIIDKCEVLASLSLVAQMGQVAPLIGDGVRLWSFQRWVIIYRYTSNGIRVLRVGDASQDYMNWRL